MSEHHKVKLTPNDSLSVYVEGLGRVYTIYTEVDNDDSIYLACVDNRNGRVVDEDNLLPEVYVSYRKGRAT